MITMDIELHDEHVERYVRQQWLREMEEEALSMSYDYDDNICYGCGEPFLACMCEHKREPHSVEFDAHVSAWMIATRQERLYGDAPTQFSGNGAPTAATWNKMCSCCGMAYKSCTCLDLIPF